MKSGELIVNSDMSAVNAVERWEIFLILAARNMVKCVLGLWVRNNYSWLDATLKCGCVPMSDRRG